MPGSWFLTKAAFKKEATQSGYGTVVACGAGDQIPVISQSLAPDFKKEFSVQAQHGNGIKSSSLYKKIYRGDIKVQAVYRGLESLFCSAAGFSHYTNSPTLEAAGVYKHTIELVDNLHAEEWATGEGSGWDAGDTKVRRGTLCFDNQVSIAEWASCMVDVMTIRGGPRGVTVTFDLVPRALDTDSATNTTSSSWSIPGGDWDSIMFHDLSIWLADYSAVTPLDSGDAIGIADFELKLANNLSKRCNSQSSSFVAEPQRNNSPRMITGTFTYPRYQNDTLLDKLNSQTAMMARLLFTGPEIGATGYYNSLWLWLPTLKFDFVFAEDQGDGLYKVAHTFTAEIPDAAPAGFPTEATKELLLQTQNAYDTNPLI